MSLEDIKIYQISWKFEGGGTLLYIRLQFTKIQNMTKGCCTKDADFIFWISAKSETNNFFDWEGSPLWNFQEIWKIAISFTDVGEKSFLG